jgi:hypothetical protein
MFVHRLKVNLLKSEVVKTSPLFSFKFAFLPSPSKSQLFLALTHAKIPLIHLRLLAFAIFFPNIFSAKSQMIRYDVY